MGSFSIDSFALCSFQVAEGDDPSVIDNAVNKAFDISIKNAKIDWVETLQGCEFKISYEYQQSQIKIDQTQIN